VRLHKAELINSNVPLVISVLLAVAYSVYYPGHSVFIDSGVDFTILIHQLPIIPYVFISIFLGIGSLHVTTAGRVMRRVVIILAVIWLCSLCILFLLAYIFSVFHSLQQGAPMVSLPAVSVSKNLQDVVVSPTYIVAIIFLISAASFGLMHIEHKEVLLKPLRVISQMIEFIFDILLTILPISLFFLLTHALGNMTYKTFQQTSVYIVTSGMFCLFFVVWVYPWALRVFAHMPIRRIQHEVFPCLWLSFLAGDCAVALPLILTALRHLISDFTRDDAQSLVSILIPIAFAVPMAGSIGNLIFLFFTSLIYQMPLDWSHYGLISLMGPLTMFSEPIISIPTMLSLLSLPQESMALYMLTGVMTDPIFDAAEAFSIIFMCYMVLYSMENKIHITLRKLVYFIVPTCAMALLMTLCTYAGIVFLQ